MSYELNCYKAKLLVQESDSGKQDRKERTGGPNHLFFIAHVPGSSMIQVFMNVGDSVSSAIKVKVVDSGLIFFENTF